MKLLYDNDWFTFVRRESVTVIIVKNDLGSEYHLRVYFFQAFQINGKGIVRRNSCHNFDELLEKALDD